MQVFAKYLQAVGGAEQLAKFTSFAGTGTYAGYETEQKEVPAEVLRPGAQSDDDDRAVAGRGQRQGVRRPRRVETAAGHAAAAPGAERRQSVRCSD